MNKLINIQYLRAFAALLVVASHAVKELTHSSHANIPDTFNIILLGQFGVDIFFIISGFIMYYVTINNSNSINSSIIFLQKRIIRIVPIYWILTIITIAISVFLSQLKNNNYLDVDYIISSFMFIPALRVSDGNITPVFGLGWTLNYEMFFYCIFAVLLLLPRKYLLLSATVVFSIIVFAGSNIEKSSVITWYWSRPIILEFILGLFIASLFNKGYLLSRLQGLIVFSSGIFIWIYSSSLVTASSPEYRFWCWGISASLIVASVMLTKRMITDQRHTFLSNIGTRVGDASFSLYLSHMFVLRALTMLLPIEFLGSAYSFIYLVLSLLLSLVIAELMFKLIEQPTNKIGLRFFKLDKRPIVTRRDSEDRVNNET